jgi:hypothetical protein
MKPIDPVVTPREDIAAVNARLLAKQKREPEGYRLACRFAAGVRTEDGRLLYPEWT